MVEEGAARRRGSEKLQRLARVRRVVVCAVWFLVGVLAGGAIDLPRTAWEGVVDSRGSVGVDLYWKESPTEEPRFLGVTSLDVRPGEEFRVVGDFGQEAILVFCGPGNPVRACGGERRVPEGEGDSGFWSLEECVERGEAIGKEVGELRAVWRRFERRCRWLGWARPGCWAEKEGVWGKTGALPKVREAWHQHYVVEGGGEGGPEEVGSEAVRFDLSVAEGEGVAG